MNKRIFSKRPDFLMAATLLAVMAALVSVSCRKGETHSKPADVDYYTCTMHPSVRSQDPSGKCPICGMGLVPVKKKTADETARVNETQASEFVVPVGRQQQIGVTYGTVQNRPLIALTRAVGAVAYDKQRHWDFVARVGGFVQKLDVFSPGEVVEKGAPLLTIYSPELLTAQKEFVDILKTREDARAKGNADVFNSAAQLVDSGKERLRLWNITADQIGDLEKTRKPEETLALFSPFKGVVQELTVEQGQRVGVGDRLVDVADLSVVWVWAQFYQDELSMLKGGLPVIITTTSLPGEKFQGTISVLDPFLNEETRTGRVRIDVNNADFKLRPGMYVDVELSVDMGEGLTVAVGAVLPTGLHNIAFVDKGGGRLEPRFIELGRKYGDFYEVRAGLKENERVVTSANFLIDAEAKVQGALKSW